MKKIEEIYFNFFPQHPYIFTTSNTLISQSICSFVASLGCKLNVRYFSESNSCLQLAQNVLDTFRQFNSISKDSITLIVLDRLIDPITPILHSWFYISAIHDLFGVKDNVFQLPGKEDETVLNFRTDNFLRMFGSKFLSDVGPAVAQELQEVVNAGRNANDTLQDTDNMVQAFYATTQYQEKLSKSKEHVAIVEAINHKIQEESLLMISELEQFIVTSDDPVRFLNEIRNFSLNRSISSENILRLGILFTLKYSKSNPTETNAVQQIILERCQQQSLQILQNIFKSSKIQNDFLFSNHNRLQQFISDLRNFYDHSESILNQHIPYIDRLINEYQNDTLSRQIYPFLFDQQTEPRFRKKSFYILLVELLMMK